ncbi:MAG TPA: PAS domain S-box protein [Phenylobacterium sp.]|nr:PAS domain S-box protein [Phenylobacterium sp.]
MAGQVIISADARLAALARLEQQFSAALPDDALDSLVDASELLICVRDLRGHVVRLSKAWEALLGHSMEEMTGQSLLSLIHPEDVWATHDVMESVNATNPVVGFVNRYRCRDGSYRRLEWSAKLFGHRVLGVAQDVTASG